MVYQWGGHLGYYSTEGAKVPALQVYSPFSSLPYSFLNFFPSYSAVHSCSSASVAKEQWPSHPLLAALLPPRL